MSDEQLQRDIANIRVTSAETVIRVRSIERTHQRLDDRVSALERWRYTVAGGWLVAAAVLQVAIQWVMR